MAEDLVAVRSRHRLPGTPNHHTTTVPVGRRPLENRVMETGMTRHELWVLFVSLLKNVAASCLASFCAGIFLAAFFFYARERWHPLPVINGTWHCMTYTSEQGNAAASEQENYVGMFLIYRATFLQVGNMVRGTDEKRFEASDSTVGRATRTRSEIDGFLQKNYIDKSRLFLHMEEGGEQEGLRESTRSYYMEIGAEKMSGDFESSVLDQKGKVVCKREQFNTEGIDGKYDNAKVRFAPHFARQSSE